jgi:hypothetical protein
MEIKEIKTVIYYTIEVVENGNTDYYRRSWQSNSWEVLMGDSWEDLLESEELEKLFQEWTPRAISTDLLDRII